jgi:hypothetical protein
VLADKEMGAKIIARVNEFSKPYGVTVENRDGTGVVAPR